MFMYEGNKAYVSESMRMHGEHKFQISQKFPHLTPKNVMPSDV